MRAKVILSAAIIALLILVPTVYYRLHSSAPVQPDVSPTVAPTPDPSSAPITAAPIRHWAPSRDEAQGVAAPRDEAADLSATNHEDYVMQRRGELAELGASDDPAALKTILASLNDADPRLREAALSATVQFGSQDAIPALQNEMGWTDDLAEKVKIQEAIDFLKLPSADTLTNENGSVTQQATEPSSPGN